MQGLRIINKNGQALTPEEITAAHKIANTHKQISFGTIEVIDPVDDVRVEYQAFKNIAFTQIGNSIYFGFDAFPARMACLGRGVILTEENRTSGPPDWASSVFTTDGSRLATTPRYDVEIDSETYESYGLLNPELPFNLPTRMVWNGGNTVATFKRLTDPDGFTFTRTDDMSFSIPDDVVFKRELVPEYINEDGDVTGTGYNVIYDFDMDQWADDWAAAQAQGLGRELSRRLKCSHGTHEQLRNYIMPINVEQFVKSNAPKSTLIKRSIPMEIVSRSQVTELDTTVGAVRTRRYRITIQLRYTTLDSNGDPVAHNQTFSGTKTDVQTTHTLYAMPYTTSHEYTYEDYPLLTQGNTGAILGNHIDFAVNGTAQFAWDAERDMSANYLSDLYTTRPLLTIVNGIQTESGWVPNTRYTNDSFAAEQLNYLPEYELTDPPVQNTNSAATFTHPQFLREYIKASPPVEKLNGVPVTPSTDWLSSRLSDGETIKIIPLNYVDFDDNNLGMYPFETLDEDDNLIINKLRIFGVATVSYSEITGVLKVTGWVEFTTEGSISLGENDTHTLDDELNPTTITVIRAGMTGSITYTLAPREIEYDPDWADSSTNIIGISNKILWSDIKTQAKTQKINISDNPPEGLLLEPDESLYRAVRRAIQ